jgi:hypothetical protein
VTSLACAVSVTSGGTGTAVCVTTDVPATVIGVAFRLSTAVGVHKHPVHVSTVTRDGLGITVTNLAQHVPTDVNKLLMGPYNVTLVDVSMVTSVQVVPKSAHVVQTDVLSSVTAHVTREAVLLVGMTVRVTRSVRHRVHPGVTRRRERVPCRVTSRAVRRVGKSVGSRTVLCVRMDGHWTVSTAVLLDVSTVAHRYIVYNATLEYSGITDTAVVQIVTNAVHPPLVRIRRVVIVVQVGP